MDDFKDATNNRQDLSGIKNAEISKVDGKNALQLKGNESFVETGIETAGLKNDLRVKVKRTSTSNEEQILFESSYGTIKAVQKESGNVGFSREGFDYSFNYALPINEWVELEFKNELNRTSLFVNGVLVDVLGDNERIEGRPLLATTMIPFARIGSKTNAFVGFVDDVRLSEVNNFVSTMALDYAVWTAKIVQGSNIDQSLLVLLLRAQGLFAQMNPSQDEITALTEQINEKVANISYQKADYSRIDAYLSMLDESLLKAFTKDSVDSLNRVIASIRKDLPKQLQSTVDGYEALLVKAIMALEINEKGDVNYVDNASLKVSASSYQDGSSAPDKVLDNDPNSMWHTKWSITTMPHWINFEMSEPTLVKGIMYQPRAGAGNGTITQYKVQISDDGINFRDYASGTLVRDPSIKEIEFTPVTTKHVRFVALAASNNNASAAEMRVIRDNVDVDFDGLNALIVKAEGIEQGNFSDASFIALQMVIEQAKELASSSNVNPNDAEVMKRNLAQAMVSLVLQDKVVESVDKNALITLVESAKILVETDYTASTWNVFATVLADAQAIIVEEEVTQAQVDEITLKLSDAMSQLVRNPELANKDELQVLYDSAMRLDALDYTQTSWNVVENAMREAKAILADHNATQKQVDAISKKLVNALEQLERVPSEVVNKKELQSLYDSTLQLNAKEYTTASWKKVTNALEEAKAVLANQNVTQKDIDKVTDTLRDAILQLKKIVKPVNPNKPTTPNMPNDQPAARPVRPGNYVNGLIATRPAVNEVKKEETTIDKKETPKKEVKKDVKKDVVETKQTPKANIDDNNKVDFTLIFVGVALVAAVAAVAYSLRKKEK